MSERDAKRMQAEGEKLRAMERDYIRARNLVNGAEYDELKLDALERIASIVDGATARGVEYSAVVMGAIGEVLHQVRQPEQTVRRYEELKKRLETMRGTYEETPDA